MKRISKIIFLMALLIVAMQYNILKLNAHTQEEPSPWAEPYIDMAKKIDLIPAEEDLQYQKAITRQSFYTYVVSTYEKLTHETIESTSKLPFTDTDDESIHKAYTMGIIQSKSISLFKPDDPMSYEEIAVAIIRTMELLETALDRQIVIDREVDLSHMEGLEDIHEGSLEVVELAVGNDLMTDNVEDVTTLTASVTVEEALVYLTKMATIVENSRHAFFLEKGNYIVNGDWWYFDDTKQFVQHKTLTNVAEGFRRYALKKDGTLYINKHQQHLEDKMQPRYKRVEDGLVKMSTWEPYQLKCITGMYMDNYGDFIVIQLDGSVWICDDSSNQYKTMAFPEPIQDVTGEGDVFIALGKSGSIYFHGASYRENESIPKMIKISCHKDFYRALDEEGFIWEWEKTYNHDLGSWQMSKAVKKMDLTESELDYYCQYTNFDLTAFKKDHQIVAIDNRQYLGCFLLDDKGDVYFNNNADQRYEQLRVSIKQYKNQTILDTEGSVWYYLRWPRAGGYQLYNPIPIPGMNKGVLIDDRICLQSDGVIWSFEVHSARKTKVIEHIVGYLPDGLKASDVVKILKYDTHILILDNQGRCWYVYTYEKVLALGLKDIPVAKLLFENMKEIGYGFVLDRNGKLHWFDIKDENVQLHFIMDNIEQLTSGEYDNLVQDIHDDIYYIGGIDDYTSGRHKTYTGLLYKIDQVPNIKKIWPGRIFPTAIAMDQDNKIYSININPSYDEEAHTITHKATINPLIIHDVKDISFSWSDIIIHKNDGRSKVWFVYEDAYKIFFWQNQTIELEVPFRKVKTGDRGSEEMG